MKLIAVERGMALKDYFAAKAMAAQLTGAAIYSALQHQISLNNEIIAKQSYLMAEEMLKAREENKK